MSKSPTDNDVQPRAPLSIYVVEDSPILLQLLTELVKSTAGVQLVGSCPDAPTAIRDIQALRPDVVLLDVALRVGTGFDVLKSVRSMAQRPIVMVLTNHTTPPYRQAVQQFGVAPEHFFDKSEQIPALFKTLGALAETGNATSLRDDTSHE